MKNRMTQEEKLHRFRMNEKIRLDYLTSLSPWLAPAIPATLSYFDFTSFMTFGGEIPAQILNILAIFVAIIIEVTGLTTGHTLATYAAHNQKRDKRRNDNKISLIPVFVAFGLYLFLVITLNVVLPLAEISTEEAVTRLALVLMTISSIIIIAVRSVYNDIVLESEVRKSDKKETRSSKKKEQPVQEVQIQPTNGLTTKEKVLEFMIENELSLDQLGGGKEYTPKQIAKIIDDSSNNVRVALTRLRNE